MPYYQKFRKIVTRAFKMGSVEVTAISTDGTLAGNSDAYIPTQKAVKTYADALANAIDAMQYKGVLDCSGNPNYPAASAGHIYIISVAGKVGGVSGTTVQVGDMIACKTDGSAAGTQAAVGANWNIIQSHTGSLYTAETSVTDNAILRYDGTTGTLIQKSLMTIDDSGSPSIPAGQSYTIGATALTYTDVGAAASGHNHDSTYLAIAGTAEDSLALGGTAAADYSLATHDHDSDYLAIGRCASCH